MSLTKVALSLASAVGTQAALNAIHRWNLRDALGVMGLEYRRRRSERVIPALGLLLAGAAVGAGAAVLLAPRKSALRTRFSGRVAEAKARVNEPRDVERSEEASATPNPNGG